MPESLPARRGLAVLTISLDSQIAGGASKGAIRGDPVERQRRYASRLDALHVVVKTGREVPPGAIPLAPNAWAYPTRSASRLTFVPDAYRLAAGLCRRTPIDVISAQDPFATGLAAYLVARRFQRPLNVQLHFDVLDNPYWLAERAEHRALNVLGKWLLRRADTIRVGTTRERQKLASSGLAPERIFVAPVPVDLERFGCARPAASLRDGLAPHGALVIAAKRLVPQKDIPTLLRAAATVLRERPHTRFVIAGDGPLRAAYERLAAELGLAHAVRFLGPVDRLEMPGLYAAADLLVVSSLYEGTSLVAVEAAAAGKPVVTTDVAGAGDTVVDGLTGRVVPVGDLQALAGAILDVLCDPQRAAAMGEAGQRHVRQRFDLDRAVEGVVTMWQASSPSPPDPHPPSGGAGEVFRGARGERGSWLYLANIRVPSEKAHVYQTFQMVDALGQAGVEVELVCPSRANLPGIADADPQRLYGLRRAPRVRSLFTLDAVKLVTIDRPALNRGPLPALAFQLQTLSFTVAAAGLARRARAGTIYSRDWPVLATVVLAGDGRSGAGAGARRATVVWEAHDLPQGRLGRALLERLLPHLSGVVAISAGLRQALLDLGLRPSQVLVAPDAVDLDRFGAVPSKAVARAMLGLPPDAPVIVYTGHLYRWKGVHTLALGARHLPPEATVCIVGGTPADLTAFRAFVAAEGLSNVRVAGYVPPAEVPTWLAAADVLALPNSGREVISARYTSPLKLFEYMAAGRPIVASDLPSLREVLTHEVNAHLVTPDDPAALGAGLQAVLADPARGDRLAARARQDVAGRTWDARAAAIVAFVHQLRPAPAGTVHRR